MGRSLAVLVLLAATGCSRIKTAYTWLDWTLERQANQYLDLTREQSDEAERTIDAYVAWHRSTMLPRYARFLRQQARVVRSAPVDRAHFDQGDVALRELYQQTMVRALDVMADLLVDQSPAQIDHFAGALAERHAELAEQAADGDRLEDRQEDYEELFEDLVGDLSPAQQSALGRRVRGLHGDPKPWLAERARRNEVIVARLRAGAERAEVVRLLRTWWLGERDPETPASYEPYRQRFSSTMRGMIFELLASLDEQQRLHLAQRLEEYAGDFEELAASSS